MSATAATPLLAAPAAVDAVVRALMQLHADESSHAQRQQAQQVSVGTIRGRTTSNSTAIEE